MEPRVTQIIATVLAFMAGWGVVCERNHAQESTAVGLHGSLDVVVCHSQALRENLLGDSLDRDVTIYLPAKYRSHPSARFPVLYLLHGYSGKNTLWTGDGYIPGIDIAKILDRSIQLDAIEPMIVVAPNCHNRYGGSWYTNSVVTGNWEQFITEELIEFIDSKYRTVAKRNARGIAGHSMGGHGALKLAMKHADKFTAVYGLSPAWVVFEETFDGPYASQIDAAIAATQPDQYDGLDWRSQAFIALTAAISPCPSKLPFQLEFPFDRNRVVNPDVAKLWDNNDLIKMLDKHSADLNTMKFVATDCGTEEDLLPMNQTFAAALADHGVKHSFEVFEGDHVNRVATQLEVKVFPKFSRAFEALAVGH